MRLLFVRHSSAVDPYQADTDDVRWLTEEGRRRARRMRGVLATKLANEQRRLTHVYTSPLVRAVQTAEILCAIDGFEGPIHSHLPMAPDIGSTAMVMSVLSEHQDDATIMFVGHEPKIRVLAGHAAKVRTCPGFKPCSICAVEWSDTQGAFSWWLDPITSASFSSLSDVPR